MDVNAFMDCTIKAQTHIMDTHESSADDLEASKQQGSKHSRSLGLQLITLHGVARPALMRCELLRQPAVRSQFCRTMLKELMKTTPMLWSITDHIQGP